MHGTTERMAYKMITQSDDNMASALYGSVGGDSLINWVKSHYDEPDLGSPPRRAGWWGNTHITPTGLVRLYAKLKRDPKVSSWLLNAMHSATKYGSDGQYQFFGLPSATSHPAIKQGWGADYDDWSRSADFNTTGFVDGDRYAVAILARGPISTYGSAISNMLTHTARLLLPYDGWYPAPYPTITSMSKHTGSTAGGYVVTIYGTDFVGLTGVSFGKTKATSVHRVSASELQVSAPAHGAASGHVWVYTDHGHTLADTRSAFTYIAPPTVTSVTPPTGSTAGGTVVTVAGTDFTSVRSVLFGTVAGTALRVSSAGSLTVAAPAQAAGTVDLRVVTAYGTSSLVPVDKYTYVAPPQATTGTSSAPSK
jgi:hypothetical protein